jgi:hypothetical protein
MSHAIDLSPRPAALRGLAGALLLTLTFGFAGAAAAFNDAGNDAVQLRFAQAAPVPGQGGVPPAPGQAAPPADTVGGQIAELRKQLDITMAQQPQFDAFAQVIEHNAQQMDAVMQQMQQNPNRNAVEDLRISVQFAQTEADGLKRLLPTLEALYASLSDQQKRTADQLLTSGPPADQPQQQR